MLTSVAIALATLSSSVIADYTGFFVLYGVDNATQRSDPILEPGQISPHAHVIFGANAFSSNMTYNSTQTATCNTMGSSGDYGIAADKSSYWHPAAYAQSATNDSWVKIPTNGHKIYYLNSGTGKRADPFEFPPGFRMVAGNQFMREAASDVRMQNVTQWICHTAENHDTWNQGTAGGFPSLKNGQDCAAYPFLVGSIQFPSCTNGNAFDPENPQAHMAYAVGAAGIQEGDCPETHPIRLPHIFMENQFYLTDIKDDIKLETLTLAQGDPTGYGFHVDFYNGWEPGVLSELMRTCNSGDGDVATCTPTTKVKKEDCQIHVEFPEKVDGPIPALPGCNPIETTNPAPKSSACPLGTYGGNSEISEGAGNGAGSKTSSATKNGEENASISNANRSGPTSSANPAAAAASLSPENPEEDSIVTKTLYTTVNSEATPMVNVHARRLFS